MEKTPGIESALDAALDAILSGDQPALLEAIRIIEGHPGREELRRLLTSAIETKEAVRAAPSEQARLRHLRMIGLACRQQERVRALHRARDAARRRRLILRPVAVAAGSLGLLLPGALAVASTAQPGDALYPAKLTVEHVQIAFTQDPGVDIELHMRFAERRMEEIDRLEQKGEEGQPLASAASNLKSHADAVKRGIRQGNAPAGLAATLERHRDGLSELADKAGCDHTGTGPGAGCNGLQQALASSNSALSQLKKDGTPSTGGMTPGPTGPLASSRPDPSPSATAAATAKADKEKKAESKVAPTPADSVSPAPTESADPAESPTPAPSDTPTPEPSASPSPDPSASPSPDPSISPSPAPTPGPDPSEQPTPSPTALPDDSAGTGTIEPHSVVGAPIPQP